MDRGQSPDSGDATLPDSLAPDTYVDSSTPDQALPADTSPDAAKPSCAALDAKGEGACEMHMGYTWDGKQCKGVSGCKCVGKDCAKLFSSKQACVNAYAHCGP